MEGGVLSECQAKSRLTHRGTSGNDDEIGPLQPRRHFIKLAKTCRQAGDAGSLARRIFLDPGKHALGDGCDPRKAFACSRLGKRKYLLLGVIENDLGIVFLGQVPRR